MKHTLKAAVCAAILALAVCLMVTAQPSALTDFNPETFAAKTIAAQRYQALTVNAQMFDVYERSLNLWKYTLQVTGKDIGKPVPPAPVTVDEQGVRDYYAARRPDLPAPVGLKPDWHVFEREAAGTYKPERVENQCPPGSKPGPFGCTGI